MNKKINFESIGVAVIAVVLFLGILLFSGVTVMLLWNWLMPEIFGLTRINYLQGVGIAILCNVLFNPIRIGGSKDNK